MDSTFTFKAPNSLAKQIAALAQKMERPKSYIIRKALERFIEEAMEDEEDYRIALERLAKDDPKKRFSFEEIKREHDLED